jgi:calcineurin-like phosphoesterase family protein
MSKNIWVISDTHFNHANILNFSDEHGKPSRTFSSVEEMNETMIQRWNSVVKTGDTVYHLGDVLFGMNKPEWMDKHFPRLNGNKKLCFGNHDRPEHFVNLGQFETCRLWYEFKKMKLLLTHVPVHPSTLEESHRFESPRVLNVHGHIHQNKSPNGPYYCVCVEQTNYTPVNIEDLAKIARKVL